MTHRHHFFEGEVRMFEIASIPPELRKEFYFLDLATKCTICDRDWTHSPQHSIIACNLVGQEVANASVVCADCAALPDVIDHYTSSLGVEAITVQ